MPVRKPLSFIGSSRDDLRDFPEEVRRAAGFELAAVQCGSLPSDWKAMPTIGLGVMEIRLRIRGEWRVIYVASHRDAVYVLHAFRKKTQRTAKSDIELARRRFREMEVDR